MTSGQEFFLWTLAVILMLVFPFAALANKPKLTQKAALVSVVGLLMALWLYMYT